MHSESSLPWPKATQPQAVEPVQGTHRQPRIVLTGQTAYTIFAFPPNRDTLGATAYFIVGKQTNILIDSPPWNPTTQEFLKDQGGVTWFFLTHRNGISQVREIQKAYGCQILIQEQEAYLLPGLPITTFQEDFELDDVAVNDVAVNDVDADKLAVNDSINGGGIAQVIWTPGYSPGSACLYHPAYGGVLFSGRHLLPSPNGELLPLRTAKTFHWRRQLQSLQKLVDRFSPETLQHLCPGANTGFLRGQRTIPQAYEKLCQRNHAGYYS